VSAEERAECLTLIREAIESGARKVKACDILDLKIRTIERWEKNAEDKRRGPLTRPGNAFTPVEREKILEVVNSKDYANLPPSQVVPKLTDKGIYIASESSIYRILRAEKQLAHRSKSSPRRHKKPKELRAIAPNEIWSWDITYLKAAIKGKYYYLYLPMDIFSRMIIHWEIHEVESAELSSMMIETAYEKHQIKKGQVTLHSDNGGPMKGATMLATLQRLGVIPSFSRPKVSDDNPFSEALFKTIKYCPSFPEKNFGSLDEAKAWVEKFVDWYNNCHLHSGIRFVTPASRHYGFDQNILDLRHAVYEKAKSDRPDRWSKKTRNRSKINVVELNPGRLSKASKKVDLAHEQVQRKTA